MNMLAFQPMNLNAIADNFDISRPAVSQQIKILTECGLLVIRQQGRERYCEAKFEGLKEVADWLEQYRKLWAERFDTLDGLLDELMAAPKKPRSEKK
jgi:DNA-binding transcriptional ArsR family regulator